MEICRFTGMPSMADDSGLVVDALEGRPGILSARYGGPGTTDRERNMGILEEMAGVEKERRSARFVCVIAIALPGSTCSTVEGTCEGSISLEMRGSHGFGYDPIFRLDEFNKTMAEIPLQEKNRISHRAKALERAREILLSQGGPDDS
jgi:XTP/dITP diphosphohydrolase